MFTRLYPCRRRSIGHIRRRVVALAAALWLPMASAAWAEITIFAAASLKTALDNALAAFEAETGANTTAAYAGSSVMARQIQLGAPADLFISANPDWMDILDAEGLLAPDSRHDLLGNELVVIAPSADGAPLDLTELPERLGQGRLAMALVNAVPVGIYGKAALEAAGVWTDVAPQVAQTDNARTTLALVAAQEAPFGIVYATDANAEPRVTVVAEIASDKHPPIVYPIAKVASSRADGTDSLLSFLSGPGAAPHFAAQGFAVLAE